VLAKVALAGDKSQDHGGPPAGSPAQPKLQEEAATQRPEAIARSMPAAITNDPEDAAEPLDGRGAAELEAFDQTFETELPDDVVGKAAVLPAKATAVSKAVDPLAPPTPALEATAAPSQSATADSSARLLQPAANVRPEVQFAAENHERIVASVRTNLLPNGGTMHIRLDPPELGALQVTVRMIDGVLNASFETSNDQAAKLLSHSLSHLKHVLESQGVSVDKLQVQQSPRSEQNNSSNNEGQQRQSREQYDGQSSRQEEQRREMLRRMWRRLGVGSDPLDLVA
jgi:flagellar hook-length control protein FliK